MATTTPSAPPVAGSLRARDTDVPGRRGVALLVALLLACLYAAFAHGAVQVPDETRVQISLAALALVTAAWWLGGGGVRPAAAPAAWLGVALLAGFAAWCTVSFAWSVTPDRTWLEVNRAIAYALVVVLAIAAAGTAPRAIEITAWGWLAVATTVALYALGGKVLPGIFGGTDVVARLRAPLDYWNALGLVCALGVPVAIRLAVDATGALRGRLAALAAGFVLIVVLGMTYSRGAFIALAVAMAVLTIAGAPRLRGLTALVLLGVAAAPVLAVAFSLDGLTVNGAPHGDRARDGLILLGVLLVCGAALLAAGRGLAAYERRWAPWPKARERVLWRMLAVLALAVVVGVLAAVGASDGGFRGVADSFTEVRADKQYDPVRLVSTTSGNRWVWWKEAAGAWSDRPLGGWGAGSFPVTHRLYRTNELAVAQPHSVPLQFLAETGLVGALLALGGIGLLLWAGAARVRALPDGRERDLAVALLAGATAWLVHGFVDWDWDIPGVTLPALLFLGVLAARPEAGETAAAPFRDPARGDGAGARAVALGAVTLAVAAIAASALLPAWSSSKTDDALDRAGGAATPQRLESAAAEADLASRLDPLAVRPLLAEAAIAQRRGRLLEARGALLDAVGRQPYSSDAWLRLAALALRLADRDGFREAAERGLAVDPANGSARALASRAQGALAPYNDSALATGTPLQAAAAPPPAP